MRRGPALYFDTVTYLTVAEASELLRCSPDVVYDACATGRLPAGKIGAQWLIKRSEIDAYLKRMAYPQAEGERPIPLRRSASG